MSCVIDTLNMLTAAHIICLTAYTCVPFAVLGNDAFYFLVFRNFSPSPFCFFGKSYRSRT